MNYLIKILSSFCFVSFALASLDCPSDTSYHIDSRTMLPDGSPNPTYGDSIATGLCSCIGFVDGTQIDGNEITFTLRIIDHEPIRGIELDIYNDAPQLEYLSYSKGSKLENVVDEEGTPRQMTMLTNYIEDHLKILAYSTSRARTEGNGEEGDLCHITYKLSEGASLPENVTFYFGVANVPGTSMNPDLFNVICSYPSEENAMMVSTATVALSEEGMIPKEFALSQNFPNPFNPSTKIGFDVPAGADFVSLTIYNLLGQNVKTLISKALTPGHYTVEWDANDDLNLPVASGIYFYELRSRSFLERKKMLLIR